MSLSVRYKTEFLPVWSLFDSLWQLMSNDSCWHLLTVFLQLLQPQLLQQQLIQQQLIQQQLLQQQLLQQQLLQLQLLQQQLLQHLLMEVAIKIVQVAGYGQTMLKITWLQWLLQNADTFVLRKTTFCLVSLVSLGRNATSSSDMTKRCHYLENSCSSTTNMAVVLDRVK